MIRTQEYDPSEWCHYTIYFQCVVYVHWRRPEPQANHKHGDDNEYQQQRVSRYLV